MTMAVRDLSKSIRLKSAALNYVCPSEFTTRYNFTICRQKNVSFSINADELRGYIFCLPRCNVAVLFFNFNFTARMHWSRTLVPGCSQLLSRTYYVVGIDLDFFFSVVSDSALNFDKCSSKNP